MSWHTIGEMSLNISTLLYIIWFIPQLILTFKQRVISSLSMGMHGILVLGYLADLVYGFGQQLPLQYKMVTIAGLSALAIEHYQFWRYNAWCPRQKKMFHGLTVVLIGLLFLALYHSLAIRHGGQFYNVIGALSWVCWLSFMWPQVLKNAFQQSTKGLSVQTILLSLLSSLGDLVSAYALSWAWPSKIGTLLGLFPRFLLLMQCYHYKKRMPVHVLTS